MPDIVGALVLPPLWTELQREAPGLTLQVVGSERNALRSLLDDEVDMVIASPKLDHVELYQRVANPGGSGWSVVLGPSHPAWELGLTKESWLASHHIQLIPAETRKKGVLDQVLSEQGAERVVRLQVAYLAALPDILATSCNLISLPTPLARWVAKQAGLRYVPHPLGAELPALTLRMAWNQIHQAEPGHAWLRSVLTRVLLSHWSDETAQAT